jgi:hypothetical protein
MQATPATLDPQQKSCLNCKISSGEGRDTMDTPMNLPGNSTAVLLLAHGTPNALGEMAEYLGKVTGGRALPNEVVEELQHRYAQIGLGYTPGAEPPPLRQRPGRAN